MSGDPAARTLLTGLLRDASWPYMAMLNEWLHHGGIKDHHAEFLVKEQLSIRRDRLEQDYTDEYWENDTLSGQTMCRRNSRESKKKFFWRGSI